MTIRVLITWAVVVLVAASIAVSRQPAAAVVDFCDTASYSPVRELPASWLLHGGELKLAGDHSGCANAYVGKYVMKPLGTADSVKLSDLNAFPVIHSTNFKVLPLDLYTFLAINSGSKVALIGAADSCYGAKVLAVWKRSASEIEGAFEVPKTVCDKALADSKLRIIPFDMEERKP